jgi:hypothetical protein
MRRLHIMSMRKTAFFQRLLIAWYSCFKNIVSYRSGEYSISDTLYETEYSRVGIRVENTKT